MIYIYITAKGTVLSDNQVFVERERRNNRPDAGCYFPCSGHCLFGMGLFGKLVLVSDIESTNEFLITS